MKPSEIPDALRNFAAAAETSPDPAKSLAELARLIAGLFERAAAHVEEEGEARAGLSSLALDDEPLFPPLQPIVATMGGHDFTAEDLDGLAREDTRMTPEEWAAVPAEERTLYVSVVLHRLRQEHAADQAAG